MPSGTPSAAADSSYLGERSWVIKRVHLPITYHGNSIRGVRHRRSAYHCMFRLNRWCGCSVVTPLLNNVFYLSKKNSYNCIYAYAEERLGVQTRLDNVGTIFHLNHIFPNLSPNSVIKKHSNVALPTTRTLREYRTFYLMLCHQPVTSYYIMSEKCTMNIISYRLLIS